MGTEDKLNAIRRGLLEFVVLTVISKEDVYAANIIAALEPTEFRTQEGTLYPLLSKIRREGAVEYVWQESTEGPPRKYYRLTARGRKQLEEIKKHWEQINTTIASLGS